MANSTTQKPAEDKLKKAQESGNEAMDKAKDAAKTAVAAGSQVAEKAKDAAVTAGAAVSEAADAGAAAVGGGLKSLAGTIKEQGPHDGMLGDATRSVAQGLADTGRYLQKEGVSGMAEDLSDMIRKNPIPAVLVGVGIGFLLASLTRS